MVTNIDDWLFRGGDDNKECEPEIRDDGTITCRDCKNTTCEYYEEMKND